MSDYDPRKDAHDSYYVAIEAKRQRGDKHWPEAAKTEAPKQEALFAEDGR